MQAMAAPASGNAAPQAASSVLYDSASQDSDLLLKLGPRQSRAARSGAQWLLAAPGGTADKARAAVAASPSTNSFDSDEEPAKLTKKRRSSQGGSQQTASTEEEEEEVVEADMSLPEPLNAELDEGSDSWDVVCEGRGFFSYF